MNNIQIAASLMCAPPLFMGKALDELENAGVDMIHFDIMDGHFVPNLGLYPDLLRAVSARARLPIDIHIMGDYPERMLDMLTLREGDMVCIHTESTPHVMRALQAIRARGARAALALNPATPLENARECLPLIDMLLVMTVNPGFAGQALIPTMLDKISRARAMLNSAGLQNVPIEADGHCSFDCIRAMCDAGASILVGGTSSVFSKEGCIEENVKKMRMLLA